VAAAFPSWQLVVAGLAVGVLVGIVGMGGGSLLTPLLVLAFGFHPTVAIGTDIAHGAVFKTVGALRHHRLGQVEGRLSGWMLLGSAPSSLAGVAVATLLRHRYGSGVDSVGGRVLALVLIAGGAGLVVKSLVRYRAAPDGALRLRRRDKVAAVVIGLLGGFVVGLTSVGSGVFFGLTMLVVFPLRSNKVVGTDILHAAALLWVAGLGHVVAGNVDFAAVGSLLVGSIPGIVAGSQLSVRVPERRLRLALATVLLLSGVRVLTPEPLWLALAPASTAAAVGLARLVRRRPAARATIAAP
jgi:uncharacterized membrane protein YfcA